MNSWLTKLAGGAFALTALLSSCKKEEVQATLTPTSTPTLAASTNTVVLTQANASNTAITYTWAPISGYALTNADHTNPITTTYTLQVAKAGTNFAAPANIDAGTGPNTVVKVSDLDAAVLAAGIADKTTGQVEVRLRSVYASNSPVYSNAVTLTATPYKFCAQPAASAAWSIIGTVGPGVDWTTDYIMAYDCDTQTYSYTGALKVGEYKFRYGGNWNLSLGGDSSTGGPLTSSNGANLKITTAGTYTITLSPTSGGGSYTIK